MIRSLDWTSRGPGATVTSCNSAGNGMRRTKASRTAGQKWPILEADAASAISSLARAIVPPPEKVVLGQSLDRNEWQNIIARSVQKIPGILPGTESPEINEKTDLNISLESLERSKHRRVATLTFAIKTQPTPKLRQPRDIRPASAPLAASVNYIIT
jgi:hypothetical protein